MNLRTLPDPDEIQTLPIEPVAMGRLRKRIEKLTKQRDHFKARCEHYAAVLDEHPTLEGRYRAWVEQRAERERVKGLEQRISEQAQLIEMLRKGTP